MLCNARFSSESRNVSMILRRLRSASERSEAVAAGRPLADGCCTVRKLGCDGNALPKNVIIEFYSLYRQTRNLRSQVHSRIDMWTRALNR